MSDLELFLDNILGNIPGLKKIRCYNSVLTWTFTMKDNKIVDYPKEIIMNYFETMFYVGSIVATVIDKKIPEAYGFIFYAGSIKQLV